MIYVTHDEVDAMTMADRIRGPERRIGRADRRAAGSRALKLYP
jgi:ABC-type Fe3+/spermidine/putrescine transport system ATPase subunit